jgi:hypothetical protein
MDQRQDVRSQFENDAVHWLQTRNVQGVPSYPNYSLADFRGGRDQVRQKGANAKAESVLIVRVGDRATYNDGPPADMGSGLGWGEVDEVRYNLSTPGGDINTDIRLEAKVFRVSDGTMMWSGLIDVIQKENYDSIVLLRTTTKAIVDRLAKDKVIP